MTQKEMIQLLILELEQGNPYTNSWIIEELELILEKL